MSAKSPLYSLASKLVDQFSKSGLVLTRQSCHQLLHAGIGSVSPEVASNKNIPIYTCRYPETRQYNLYATIKRAEKCLGVGYFQAVGIAEEIIESLRSAGVGVNQVQLLLDPSFSPAVKKQAFKALRKNLELNDDGVELEPMTATLAIASKKLPRPDITWDSRLSLAAAYPPRGPSDLVELVTSTECYLWAFPPADNRETSQATIDRYFASPLGGTAELGMGFSIITAGWVRPKHFRQRDQPYDTFTQYGVYSPMWSCRVSNTSTSPTWYLGNILYSSIRDGAPWSSDRLSDLLPNGLASLPRLRGCHTCRMLFIDEASSELDIPTRCLCDESSQTKGNTPLTTNKQFSMKR